MRIDEMIKSQQPEIYKALDTIPKKKDEKLNNKDIEMLMSHSFYRRGRGGAKRQVR